MRNRRGSQVLQSIRAQRSPTESLAGRVGFVRYHCLKVREDGPEASLAVHQDLVAPSSGAQLATSGAIMKDET